MKSPGSMAGQTASRTVKNASRQTVHSHSGHYWEEANPPHRTRDVGSWAVVCLSVVEYERRKHLEGRSSRRKDR